MRKLRPGGARTSLDHKTIRSLLPPSWLLLPIFQVLGCASRKQATPRVAEQPCWEVLLGVRPSPKVPGAWGGAEIPLLWALVAASCHLYPELGHQCPHLCSWAGPSEWGLYLGHQHAVMGSRLCGYTCALVGELQPMGLPCPDQFPRTCCTATFDLLLRLWVWPRPRSRLLREVWACIPAQRLWARRGGPGRARAACRTCGLGDKDTWGARPSFPASGSRAQGTARPHPSLPSLTPSVWPPYSELPDLEWL